MYAWESIQAAVEYIEDHITENIETKTLAEIACLSPFYFQRLFKRLVKKPVQEYCKLRRLSLVIKELQHSEKRILDVALQYGFSDHANFTRAFKECYHMTPDAYRMHHPMLNTFDKPELSSNYTLMDENVPLVVGDIVLEIQRRSIDVEEIYFGLEKEIWIAQQLPLGESMGVDVPGQLWHTFHKEKQRLKKTLFHAYELGVSHSANPEKQTFRYFAGGMVATGAVCPKNMVAYALPIGTYIVCQIEAASFEKLVTTALNQANTYLFETWLPNHKLTTKPYMIEKYSTKDASYSKMEIWVAPITM